MKITFALHMTGAFRPVPQSCTSSTLLRHRSKSPPTYATLTSIFIFKQALNMQRIEREKKIVGQMIEIYCRRHHMAGSGNLCEDCRSLHRYAMRRLDRCPHGNRKPSCRKCKIHCYSPEMRLRIKCVMRYVGPRMIFIHPVSAIRHLISEFV